MARCKMRSDEICEMIVIRKKVQLFGTYLWNRIIIDEDHDG